ncbi:MAG: PD-(D/E)XK nuclease family protein [Zetaproteobacteria bacterium]|nr:PD-(D/E)XK nuclease family protein [Zetaproteobacteria bacterium]
MQIIFDMAYDQQVAPHGSGAGSAAIGTLYVGPQGLLNVLETQLGLTGREIHHEIRIHAYMQRMKDALSDADAGYYRASFQEDGWSSARQLLGWRDELVLAGWNGAHSSDFTAKLAALALLEKGVADEVRQSLGDRLQRVAQVLSMGNQSLHIASVIVEGDAFLPHIFTNLFGMLAEMGVSMVDAEHEIAPSDGNLGIVKDAMFDASKRRAMVQDHDDTLVLLQADDEWAAASVVSAWLKADQKKNKDVLVIQKQGSDVLDQALAQSGLPVQGGGARSPWRSALQVLPLAIANCWAPLSISTLLELLSLPVSPVPAVAAKYLRAAIQHEPGIDGESWKKAESKILEKYQGYYVEAGECESDALERANRLVREIREFLVDHKSGSEGIEPKRLQDLCEWVKQGFVKAEVDQHAIQAMAQAGRLAELASKESQPIPRAQVDRMLDSIIAEGARNPDDQSEAAPWMRVADPSAIASGVETIVWWDFIDHGSRPSIFWSQKERAALAGIGVELESSIQRRQRESAGLRRALKFAGKRLILVAPEKHHGTVQQLHPLWDEIRYFAADPSDKNSEDAWKVLVQSCSSLLESNHASFMGRGPCQFELRDRAFLEAGTASVTISEGAIQMPEKLSYSQMSTLLGCPAKWALQYASNLRPMDSLSLPTGNQMIGTLSHRIVEELYTDPDLWGVETIREQTEIYFDQFVPQMAAELLEAGRDVERCRYRDQVADAVVLLVNAINKAKLTVTKTEGQVQGKSLGSIPFHGYIDLLLADEAGRAFVIDLKWSGSSRYKKAEVENGEALQLASYAWMLQEKPEDDWAPGAYFMLAQGELLTADSSFQAYRTLESPLSVQEIWQRGEKSWTALFQDVQEGHVAFTGMQDEELLNADREERDLMVASPPCHFCEFGNICGKTRGAQ